MSRVEVLANSRDNLSVKFSQLIRIVSRLNKVAIVFEGEDEKYYSTRLNYFIKSSDWEGLNAGGKKKVIKLREFVREHEVYSNAKCLFFVDHDFDDNSNISSFQDLYITPCYSIENLYLSEEVFKSIINAEFHLSESADVIQDYTKAMSLYRATKSQYLEAISNFNYMIRELRKLEEIGLISGKLNINNINFDSLVTVNLGDVVVNYDENNFKSLFPDLNSDIAIDSQSSEAYFSDKSKELWFRGKQNIEFLREFLIKLKADRVKKKSRDIFEERSKVRLTLATGNTISELSNYAETPECLKAFLRSQNFIQ